MADGMKNVLQNSYAYDEQAFVGLGDVATSECHFLANTENRHCTNCVNTCHIETDLNYVV